MGLLLHLRVTMQTKVEEYIRDIKQLKCIVYFLVHVGIILELNIILQNKLRMVRHTCNTVLKRLRQEDHELKAFLGYIDIPILL